MKTAIFLSCDLFLLVNSFAQTHSMSHNELFTTVIRKHIKIRSSTDLTERINAACVIVETRLPPDLAHATRKKLLAVEW